MVAERIQLSQVARQPTLLAVFLEESAAENLVARLAELEVEPAGVSVLRVALGNLPTRIHPVASPPAGLSSRYATIGILLGCFFALLIGLSLYATNFLQLSLLEALLVHTLALVILGGVLGGAIGAIWASVQAQKQAALLLPQSTDGFIVVMKVAPHLTAQCEALARELGARKFLS
jgi:hypothetical protein